MIVARFSVQAGHICGFTIAGHSGSAEAGEDIVCSAVSSPAYMTANTMTEIMGLHPEIEVEDGYLSLLLPKDEIGKGEDLLLGFRLHMEQLALQYPNYIKVERGADNA